MAAVAAIIIIQAIAPMITKWERKTMKSLKRVELSSNLTSIV